MGVPPFPGRPEAEFVSKLEVCSRPEGGERRQIVRADRDCSLTGVIPRRADRSCGIPLEVEQPERQHARLQHLLAEPFGDGTEVLSDDEAPIAHALEGENAEELLKGIVDVAAI